MEKKNFKLTGLIFACAVMSACSNSDVSSTSPNKGAESAGDADFTNYVAVGDSLTAGYTDGALYLLGETNSFPAILAQQFAAVGGGAFEQPLVSDNLGGLLFNGNPNPEFGNRLVLNTVTETPERLPGTPTTEVIGSGLNGMIFNNMGVPGAKSYHLGAPGYGNATGLAAMPATANPYFVRFSSDITSNVVTVIGDAAGQQPSFFTLWIGNNDVLNYATEGGTGVDQTGNPDVTTYNDNDITDPGAFAGIYGQLVTALTANPATKGVLINIPDISTIPYFTTVPYNPIPMDQAQADAANAGYAAYNAGIAQALAANPSELAQRTITFVAGQNAVVIEDQDLTDLTGNSLPSIRQATSSDLIVLPASAIIGTEKDPGNPASVIGVGVALEDGDVLIPSEIHAITTARLAYNATIEGAANANTNLEFFDVAVVMTQLSESGIDFGTGSVNADFATGGAFGLDGVHPTGRGYSIIANSIIDVINTGFNANVYQVDPATYPSIFLE